jgi:pimeloyl-ACP methyl ester carboxylesterase
MIDGRQTDKKVFLRTWISVSILFFLQAAGQDVPVVTDTAEVNGTKLYYEVMGEGPALVLIHGGGVDRRMWDEQFKVFAQHYQVIRYDVRGAGKSEVPMEKYSHQRDLYALLKFLKISKTSLLGLSRGGRIATSLILEHPEMVDALILASSNLGRLPDAYRQRFAATLSAANQEGLRQAVEVFLDDSFLAPGREHVAARQNMRKILTENLPMFLFLRDSELDLRLDPPVSERLSEIRISTLIISGGRDHPIAQSNADTWEARIAGSRKVVIPDAAHLANMDQPEQFNRVVLDFLKNASR